MLHLITNKTNNQAGLILTSSLIYPHLTGNCSGETELSVCRLDFYIAIGSKAV